MQLAVADLLLSRLLELWFFVRRMHQRPRLGQRADNEAFFEERVGREKELGQARARTRFELTRRKLLAVKHERLERIRRRIELQIDRVHRSLRTECDFTIDLTFATEFYRDLGATFNECAA